MKNIIFRTKKCEYFISIARTQKFVAVKFMDNTHAVVPAHWVHRTVGGPFCDEDVDALSEANTPAKNYWGDAKVKTIFTQVSSHYVHLNKATLYLNFFTGCPFQWFQPFFESTIAWLGCLGNTNIIFQQTCS